MFLHHFQEHFHLITDKRQDTKIKYSLFEILFGSLCSVIAGATGWFDIREYILGHHDWFKKNGLFLQGVPVDDTFARIISSINPTEFHQCFVNWMASVHQLTDGEVVAIDGKTLRGSYDRDDRNSTIHMVSAYACANNLILGQLKTDDKSNEITAIPKLIKMLDLRGALVTIDAMGCQTKIANTIIKQGGDYLLAVKNNQTTLRKAIEKVFSDHRAKFNDKVKFDNQHGRYEARQCYVIDSSALGGNFSRWKSLKSIVMIESARKEKGKELTLEYRYYISSKDLCAKHALSAVREHWGIESMHWILDVTMNEDDCQIYRDNGAENLAALRHISLNMLRKEETKVSIVGKRKRCLMNTGMLEKVIQAGLFSITKD